MISRPSLDEVREWRMVVDAELDNALPSLRPEATKLIELGIQHEQQHQELFLTDLLATFAENPLEPAYGSLDRNTIEASEIGWLEGRRRDRRARRLLVRLRTPPPSRLAPPPRHRRPLRRQR